MQRLEKFDLSINGLVLILEPVCKELQRIKILFLLQNGELSVKIISRDFRVQNLIAVSSYLEVINRFNQIIKDIYRQIIKFHFIFSLNNSLNERIHYKPYVDKLEESNFDDSLKLKYKKPFSKMEIILKGQSEPGVN